MNSRAQHPPRSRRIRRTPSLVFRVVARQSGGSLVVSLPPALTAPWRLEPGDTLTATQSHDGILITPFDESVERAVAKYETLARRYRNALKIIANAE